MACGWSEFHGPRIVIELDHGAAGEEYAEVLAFYPADALGRRQGVGHVTVVIRRRGVAAAQERNQGRVHIVQAARASALNRCRGDLFNDYWRRMQVRHAQISRSRALSPQIAERPSLAH